MAASLERRAEIVRQRADVSSFAAHHAKMDFRKIDGRNFKLADADSTRPAFHFLAPTCFLIQTFAANFDGRMGRWKLLDIAQEALGGFVNLLFADMRDVEALVDFRLQVVRRGGGAQIEGSGVFLFLALK